MGLYIKKFTGKDGNAWGIIDSRSYQWTPYRLCVEIGTRIGSIHRLMKKYNALNVNSVVLFKSEEDAQAFIDKLNSILVMKRLVGR